MFYGFQPNTRMFRFQDHLESDRLTQIRDVCSPIIETFCFARKIVIFVRRTTDRKSFVVGFSFVFYFTRKIVIFVRRVTGEESFVVGSSFVFYFTRKIVIFVRRATTRKWYVVGSSFGIRLKMFPESREIAWNGLSSPRGTF